MNAYMLMNVKEQTALFSTMVKGKLVHDFDQLIGRKSYNNISFSKKHFIEVTMPFYRFDPWPKKTINELSSFATQFFNE